MTAFVGMYNMNEKNSKIKKVILRTFRWATNGQKISDRREISPISTKVTQWWLDNFYDKIFKPLYSHLKYGNWNYLWNILGVLKWWKRWMMWYIYLLSVKRYIKSSYIYSYDLNITANQLFLEIVSVSTREQV